MASQTQIRYAIAKDVTLRLRVEAMLQQKMLSAGVSATERHLLTREDGLPLDEVLWVVASNPSVATSVTTQIDTLGIENITDAIDAGIPDADLEYIILTELSFLA